MVWVHLYNENSNLTYNIDVGDPIAQLLVCPVIFPTVTLVERFHDTTERGTRGFGLSSIPKKDADVERPNNMGKDVIGVGGVVVADDGIGDKKKLKSADSSVHM